MYEASNDGCETPRWPDFHWWRERPMGYVGRPPSPFPASFEHAKKTREDSAIPMIDTSRKDSATPRVDTSRKNSATPRVDTSRKNSATPRVDSRECQQKIETPIGESACDEGTNRKLYWPLYSGPCDDLLIDEDDCNITALDIDEGKKKKKTPRLPVKRPAWRHVSQPNKNGISRVPPPYTNHCRDTLFDTKTAHPMKLSTGRLMINS